MSVDSLTDIFISVAACFSVLVYGLTITRHGKATSLERRIVWLLLTVAAIMLARVLFWVLGWDVFERVLIFSAFSLPLMILITGEGVLKQHAPLLMKGLTTSSCLMGLYFATIGQMENYEWSLYALASLQIGACLFCIVWGLIQKRGGFTSSELAFNKTFCAVLAIVVPLIITDFSSIINLPFRLGGLGIILSVLVLLRRSFDLSEIKVILFELSLILFVSSMILITSISVLSVENQANYYNFGVVIVCLLMFSSIIGRVFQGRMLEPRVSALGVLVETRATDVLSFLSDALDTSYTKNSYTIIDDLSDYCIKDIVNVFEIYPVITLDIINEMNSDLHAGVREQLLDIFLRHNGTHAFLLSNGGVKIILLSMPPMSNSENFTLYTKLVQKMAQSMYMTDGKHA